MTCDEFNALRGVEFGPNARKVSDTEVIAAMRHVTNCPVCNGACRSIIPEDFMPDMERFMRVMRRIETDPEVE